MISTLVVATLLASTGTSAPRTADAAKLDGPAIRWERTFTAARQRAKAQAKPILIDFWAEWCGWCHELDKTTYRDPRVVELTQRFVAVKVDTEGSRAESKIAADYRVESLPTIAFVSPEGRVLFRVNGFQAADAFVKTLERATQVAADVVGWETALAQNPKDANALAKLGAHLFDSEFYEESRDLLRRAAAVDAGAAAKDRKHTRTLLGIIHHFAGSYADAEKVLNEALALKPDEPGEDAASLYTVGRVYLKTNRTAEARAVFKKVMETYPDTKPAVRAREALESLQP